ncbi:hypothetical protein Y032_0498g2525 [Ancylostoma ceylanicum]|uniref:Uncharacterized protein n=1 Tax=Ancylostoma ceylanicum TaxID=53326 RepID=A0A016WUJ4_9BILA|nr:hypothetical protein Y032_0498g2525 [Ancylostoma ceylanicum]
MAKKQRVLEAAFVRLTVKIELLDTSPFTEDDFKLFVVHAVKRVLGVCGPHVQIGSYDDVTHRGSIIVNACDTQVVWAALTITGQFHGRIVAAHFFSLTEFEAGEDFLLTPLF